MRQIKYCLFNADGSMRTDMMSGWRKGVENNWLRVWDGEPYNTWKYWYNRGYRIKKVRVTIELLGI